MKPTTIPIWEHDCDSCTYHGTFEGFDIYTCNDKINNNRSWRLISILARYGNEGNEYYSVHFDYLFSGNCLSKYKHAIHKALKSTQYQYYEMAKEIAELEFYADETRDLFRKWWSINNNKLSIEDKEEKEKECWKNISILEDFYYERKGL